MSLKDLLQTSQCVRLQQNNHGMIAGITMDMKIGMTRELDILIYSYDHKVKYDHRNNHIFTTMTQHT